MCFFTVEGNVKSSKIFFKFAATNLLESAK